MAIRTFEISVVRGASVTRQKVGRVIRSVETARCGPAARCVLRSTRFHEHLLRGSSTYPCGTGATMACFAFRSRVAAGARLLSGGCKRAVFLIEERHVV